VQTSTVTVAVLPEVKEYQLHLDECDIEWQTCRGSGAGGQHRNKTESAVQMTHIPTGLRVRVENERSQHSNRALAMEILRARVYELKNNAAIASRADDRRVQIGSGMRGDKRFTIAVQRDQVTDHVTGKQISYKSYSRGNWEGFHD
jgi:peptide chain release factor 1